MANIAIIIATPQGTRVLSFSDEREAADSAEMILRQLPSTALPAPVWIECPNAAIRQHLTNYLAEVQAELVGL